MSDVTARRQQLRLGETSAPGKRSRRPASSSKTGISRLAVSRAEAAEALGMSLDSFERYVQAEVRLVRRNSLRLIPVRELERWVEENAERLLGIASDLLPRMRSTARRPAPSRRLLLGRMSLRGT